MIGVSRMSLESDSIHHTRLGWRWEDFGGNNAEETVILEWFTSWSADQILIFKIKSCMQCRLQFPIVFPLSAKPQDQTKGPTITGYISGHFGGKFYLSWASALLSRKATLAFGVTKAYCTKITCCRAQSAASFQVDKQNYMFDRYIKEKCTYPCTVICGTNVFNTSVVQNKLTLSSQFWYLWMFLLAVHVIKTASTRQVFP